MGSWDTAGCSSAKVGTHVRLLIRSSNRTLFSIAVCTRSTSDCLTVGDMNVVSLTFSSRSTPG